MDAPLFAEGKVTNSEFRDHRIFVEPDPEGWGFHVSELWYEDNEATRQEESAWLPGAKRLHGHLEHIGHEIEWHVFTDKLLLPHLIFLEQSLHAQAVRGSREKLEQLLSPGFVEVGASGVIYHREQIINLLLSSSAVEEIHSASFEFKRLGPGVAILVYRTWHLGQNGERVREAFRSSVWSCSLGQWALVFHQGTLCEESGNAT